MEWHSLETDEVLSELKASKNGLKQGDAEQRLEKHGRNSISIKKKISPLKIFLEQFKNMLVLLLMAAALVSFVIAYLDPHESDYIDAVLIATIVIANAVFGFFQEYKAEKTIEALTKMSAPRATVLRNGKEREIDSELVVPGDILVLREGDKVAADAFLLESYSISSDESALTGESVPSEKMVGAVKKKTSLAERSNMVFMNSAITRGRGFAVVTETGLKTEVGKIARQISEAPSKVTQFQIELADIGRKISYLVLVMLVAIGGTNYVLGTGDLLFIFTTAVALGVAAIPEGLPAVVTLALSIATNRMLKQNALMRKLSTVQDLGAVDVICTDKTGTLTENVMTVTRIFLPGAVELPGKYFDVTGKGLAKEGNFISRNGKVDELEMLFKCAVLCNDAKEEDGHFKGDPTEVAVLIPAFKAGVDVGRVRGEYRRISEVPFSSERKVMSTLNQHRENKYSFVKGAPEVLLSRCTRYQSAKGLSKLTKKNVKEILEKNEDMAKGALRVLGFAYKENPKSDSEKDMETGLVFLGLMGMIDPPREGVREAIEDCRKAGIRVIMITGDNRFTAQAIGKELGFRGSALTGGDLDEMDEATFHKTVEKTDIYARTSPKHKVMLLKALQKNKHIVCMTGDGVNDAAAIKNSDVGIAMGIRGTEVTKQASDIIVLDDNFVSIRNAISEGRGTFDNIRKFVTLLIGANASEVLAIFLITVSPLALAPKIAVQLLWINLLTDGLPALALGADPPAKGIMERKPRPKSERLINKNTLYFIAWMGIVETIMVLALYSYYFFLDDVVKAYTIFFTGFVVLEAASVYLVRIRYKSPFFSNKWLHMTIILSLLLQLAVLYTDEGNKWFQVVPLGLQDWLNIGLAGLVLSAVVMGAMRAERFFVKPEE
jgi:P-type Ca2+ transporter type 2C